MTHKDLEIALKRALLMVFESPNVTDSNLEAANVVDTLNHISNAGRKIARAITADASAGVDVHGGRIESLTEAAMGVSQSLSKIASAITDLADAVRETQTTE